MASDIGLKKTNICEEAPVELYVNNKKLVTFMCTPVDLKELALGYLFSRGLIKSIKEVQTLAACEDMRKIFVMTANPLPEGEYSLNQVIEISCGSGSYLKEDFIKKEKIESDFTITIKELKTLSLTMFDRAHFYKKMGGFHCACLADDEKILYLREDVGRHNAVDKVIGKGVLDDIDFSKTIIMTTGRISVDMILKAVAGKIPIVVSRSIPTTLALSIAEEMGITVVGRIVSREPIIYTHGHRILEENEQLKELQRSICS